MKAFFTKNTINRLIGTIFALIPIINMFTTWYALDVLKQKGIVKFLLFIIFIFTYLVAFILSIYWLWVDSKKT